MFVVENGTRSVGNKGKPCAKEMNHLYQWRAHSKQEHKGERRVSCDVQMSRKSYSLEVAERRRISAKETDDKFPIKSALGDHACRGVVAPFTRRKGTLRVSLDGN